MRKIVLLLSTLLFTLNAVLAQTTEPPTQSDSPGVTLLREMAEVYKNLKSYHFELLRTTSNTSEAEGLRQEGKNQERFVLIGAAPARQHMALSTIGGKYLLVSDGTTRWHYQPVRNEYTKMPATAPLPQSTSGGSYDFSNMVNQRAAFLGSYANLAFDPRMFTISVLGEEQLKIGERSIKCTVLQAVSTRTGSSHTERKFWIENERKVIWREEGKSNSKSGRISYINHTSYEFSVIKINEPVSETRFSFTPGEKDKEIAEFKAPARPTMTRVSLTGKDALPFTLKDLTGKPFELASAKDKIVLLDFWASWCGPCVAEMPHIQKLHEEFKDKGLLVVGINNEESGIASEFMKDKKYTFASLVDEGRAVAKQYQIGGIPQVLLIGRDGKVKWHSIGFGNGKEKELHTAVEKVLNNETPAPSSSFPSMAVRP